jgi:hypothetical protein
MLYVRSGPRRSATFATVLVLQDQNLERLEFDSRKNWPLKTPVKSISSAPAISSAAFAIIWVSEKDLALQQLTLYAGQPGLVDYGDLKLDPDWDSLRGDPRFEKIVASLAPK